MASYSKVMAVSPAMHEQPLRTNTEDGSFNSHPQDDIELRPVFQKEHSSYSHLPILETNTRHAASIPTRPHRNIIRSLWVTVWLPLVSFTYLIFCYVAHYRTISVKVWHVQNTVEHLAIVKGGVTSISIIIITLALLPIRSLISDLRSEEFFRVLHLKQNGITLSTINSISTPSFGTMATISAVVRRKCSNVFAGALFVTIVGIAASTLAPAALSVQSVQINGEVMAYRVGAVFRNSVWNSTNEGVFKSPRVSQRLTYAAAVPWMDLTLGSRYGWTATSDEQYNYAVPKALDVPLNVRVRYLTDVISMQPSCSWLVPDSKGPTPLSPAYTVFNFTNVGFTGMSVRLPGIYATNRMIYTWDPDPSYGNELEDLRGDPLVDGTTVMMLGECQANCEQYSTTTSYTLPEAKLNMASLPTISQDVADGLVNQTWSLSFLVCSPHPSFDAREVETDGQGGITVTPHRDESVRPRQGNLDPTQTKVLLGQALSELQESGPKLEYLGNALALGGTGQISLIFGDQVSNLLFGTDEGVTPEQAILTPLPIEKITRNYARALHGAMKVFLDGSMAVSYVPGRTYSQVLVFTSSLPHVIVSTVVFFFLTLFLVVCHFRTPVPQFTFFQVATALAGSECPALFEETASKLRDEKGRIGRDHENDAMAVVGDKKIIMEGSVGQPEGTIRLM